MHTGRTFDPARAPPTGRNKSASHSRQFNPLAPGDSPTDIGDDWQRPNGGCEGSRSVLAVKEALSRDQHVKVVALHDLLEVAARLVDGLDGRTSFGNGSHSTVIPVLVASPIARAASQHGSDWGIMIMTRTPHSVTSRRARRAVVATASAALGLFSAMALTTRPADAAAPPMCFGLAATIVGTSGDDVLAGTGRTDVIVGLGGDDGIAGGGGTDYICGNAGADRLHDGCGSTGDYISGGDGDDTMYACQGSVTLMGDAGDDYIQGGTGADVLDGGAGNDDLFGRMGDDVIHGGAGNDMLSEAEVYGSDFDRDQLYGDAGYDTLDAGDRDVLDVIDGGTQTDVCTYDQTITFYINKADQLVSCDAANALPWA